LSSEKTGIQLIQVKSTNIFYIGTSFKVQSIQDSI
jgi:hypothetical protein